MQEAADRDTVKSPARQVRIENGSTTSDELLQQGDKLWIRHRGETYLLRRTANDRLILVK